MKPITLSAEQVRALLAGTPVEVRLPVKPQPTQPIAPQYRDAVTGTVRWGHDLPPTPGGPVLEYESGAVVPMVGRCRTWEAPSGEFWVRQPLWVSDCGQYFARETEHEMGYYDVLAADGSRVWWWGRPRPGGWKERLLETPHRTGGWTNLHRRSLADRRVNAFRLHFWDYAPEDVGKPQYPLRAIADYTADFRRRRAASRMPRWASRLTVEVREVRCEQAEGAWWWLVTVKVSK